MKYPIDLEERVSRTLYLFGSFEPAITALVSSLVKPNNVVFDVGANFGYFTAHLSRLVGQGGFVYAFEPDPRNIERLSQTITSNDMGNATIERCALYDRVGSVTFHLSTNLEDNMGSSSIIQDDAGRAKLEVPSDTIDHFMATRGIGQIDFMKMDIEGGEVGALAGASEALRRQSIRRLLLELHVGVVGVEEARKQVDQLVAYGYLARMIDESGADMGCANLIPVETVDYTSATNPHILFDATSDTDV